MKSINYLEELRNKRKDDGSRRRIMDDKQWEKYINDQTMNEYQRLEEIKLKAQLMEERARMDEKYIKFSNSQDDTVQRSIDVNDMYLEAIQTKLRILD